jgi:hypothetical protein
MAAGMTKSLVVLSRSHQSIRMVDVATATVRTLVSGLDEAPDGVVVDQTNGHIYWTNMGRPDAVSSGDDSAGYFQRDGSIERVNLDGRQRTTIVPRGAFTTGKQLTADFSAGHLYWCDREGMKVLRANLDGSDLTVLYAAGQTDEDAQDPRNHCVGIAVDPVTRRLFWTQKGPPKGNQGRIFTAGLELPPETNPAKRSDVCVLWSGLPEPIDLELDSHKRLVWTDRGAEPDGNTLNRMSSKGFGSAPQILSRGYREAIGVAVDGDRYYVSDLSGSIRVVDLSARTDEELIKLEGTLNGIAIVETS